MKNTLLSRLVSLLLSVVLALSVITAFFGITSLFLLRSEKYVESRVSLYSDELKSELEECVMNEFSDSKIPASVAASAVDNDLISYINGKITTAITLQNTVDLSTDTNVYNAVIKRVNDYAKNKKIALSKDEANKAASLTVDIISGFFATGEFNNNMLEMMHGTAFMAASFGSVILAVLCIVLLNLVNKGRHKMYSYIGMGLVSAGYVQIITFAVGLRYHLGNGVRYVSLDALDRVLSDVMSSAFTVQLYAGAVMLAAGMIMLALNYRYFTKKNKRVAEQRELENKMRSEYMMQYNSKNSPSKIVPGEREVMDIEF